MKTTQEMQMHWIEVVFENIEKMESKIVRGIENQSLTEESLDKLRNDLQLHYGALSNLRKSFDSNTFFTGYF